MPEAPKKGNQWYFKMKIHLGVNSGIGLIHKITTTSAKVNDITEACKLIREDDEVVYGDSGYIGLAKREEIKSDAHLSQIDYRINLRPSQMKKETKFYTGVGCGKYIENRKSSVRCKVEHAFLIVKRQLGYAIVSYRGIAKNLNRFYVSFAMTNIFICIRAGNRTVNHICMG